MRKERLKIDHLAGGQVVVRVVVEVALAALVVEALAVVVRVVAGKDKNKKLPYFRKLYL